jgi:hypothetical protein
MKMAREKYTITNTVDIVGRLDFNDNGELTVYVTEGTGDKAVTMAVDIMTILDSCAGRQIMLKLTDEENGCDE